MDISALYQSFAQCTGVTTDSRHCPEGALFIALKGETFNGNRFAAKALESGCRMAVVDEADCVPAADGRYLLVDNCLQALQQLAHEHRRRMGTRIIGITGTNGKTTTKELMAAVLKQRYRLLYTEGNLNNAIGVPLTLLRLKPEHELAVVEMGASHPGDIRELVEIAEPDYGIITNVGKAHLLGFGSLEGVVKTKGELYDFLRTRPGATVFIHRDNPHLCGMAQGLKLVTYGSGEGLYVSGHSTGHGAQMAFEWSADDDATPHRVQTQLIGDYNLPNALAAACIGRYFGVEPASIDRALEEYTPQNNRSQLVQTADNRLIVDAYNANPTSMMAAIDNFRRMDAPHKTVILGDMRELGEESRKEHQKIADYLGECGFETVWLVGSEFASAQHGFRTFKDAAEVTAALRADKPKGRTILIKGSNGIKLSTIIGEL